jgi:predicted RNA-binding protein with TRAM domain
MDDYLNHTAALESGTTALSPARRAELQRLNYAGKVAGLATINSGQISNVPANIGASSWSYQAERGNLGTLGVGGGSNVKLNNGWRGMTGESDLGLWGTLQTLSADVVTDDPIFGVVGYGADVSQDAYSTTVLPKDGLQRRLNLVTQQFSVDLENDAYSQAIVGSNSADLRLDMLNRTGAAHSGIAEVNGLAQGSYAVIVNGVQQRTVNVYRPTSAAGSLPAPTRVAFDAPAGASYIVHLVSTAPGTNTAPVVDAGPDQSGLSADLDKIALSGSASDDGLGAPNGTLTTQWSVQSAPTGATVAIATPTSKRTDVTTDKAGTYVFALRASDGALTSTDTVSVTVNALQPLPADWVTYGFDSSSTGTVPDTSGNGNTLALKGTASTTTDGSATVLRLDGGNGNYAQLPNDILSRSTDLTISTRVKVDAVNTFGRIFDFGNSTQKYLFLTPKMADGKLGVALTTSGNGAEQRITTNYTMTANTWTDIKVTFKGNTDGTTTGTIFVNGTQVGQNPAMPIAPKDLGRTSGNYLGKSQFPDPYLRASYDTFEIDGVIR